MHIPAKILLPILFVFIGFSAHAQRKSDLIAQIDDLNKQLREVRSQLAESQKNEKVSQAESETYLAQVEELKKSNASLMESMTGYAEVSNKATSNMERTMATLKQKEKAVRTVSDALSSNDSTAIVAITEMKQVLGENAKIGVQNNGVAVVMDNNSLFKGDGADVADGAKETLEKLAMLLGRHQDFVLYLQNGDAAGNMELNAQRSGALADILISEHQVNPLQIAVLTQPAQGFASNSTFLLAPKFLDFYNLVRENLK